MPTAHGTKEPAMNADLRGLADRVAALLTDWGDTEMREERDAIAAELRSLSVAQGQGWEAVPESGGQGFDFVDIANRAQYATGYGIMPSTAKAVIEAAGVTHPTAQAGGAVTEAIDDVRNAELFEDGCEADLHDAGIKTVAAAYMAGRQDACDELAAALAQGGGNER